MIYATATDRHGRRYTVETASLACDAGHTIVTISGKRYNAYRTESAAFEQLRAWGLDIIIT